MEKLIVAMNIAAEHQADLKGMLKDRELWYTIDEVDNLINKGEYGDKIKLTESRLGDSHYKLLLSVNGLPKTIKIAVTNKESKFVVNRKTLNHAMKIINNPDQEIIHTKF